MKKQFVQNILMPYLTPDITVMGILCIILLFYNKVIGLIALVVFGAMFALRAYLTEKVVLPRVVEYENQQMQDNDQIMYTISQSSYLALCAIDPDGKIIWRNDKFVALCRENGPVSDVLTKEKINEIFSGEQNVSLTLRWGEKFYQTGCSQLGGNSPGRLLVFGDVTNSEKIKQLYKDRKCCVAYISVDNYDEILADTDTEEQSSVVAAIDICIRNWAAGMNAAVTMYKGGSYVIVFEQRFIDGLREKRFPILNEIHEIVTGADFPTSVSGGIGCDSANLDDLQQDAREALDLALGRGGDQIVVKRSGRDNEYFGGALPTVEKRNKGKSRMVAHALIQQMASADRVVIMGHSRPDMDSIGSSIGLYHLAELSGKESCIVLNEAQEAIKRIYDAAVKTGKYRFMTESEVLPLITPQTLLVVTDCHSKYMVESSKVAEAAQKIVIVDHHRRSKGAIENATLVYTEVYASSASELVTELLEYSGRKVLDRFAAGALLAGITVDTKNFTVNTGVRTFEAASWLRRNGADSAEVKDYFKLRLDFVQKKYNIIASAEILEGGIAVAYTKENDPSMQVLAAQAADELLEMQGVRAAFTAGSGARATMVSARSAGQINVQTIMEKMGGGGHMNVAAAQVAESPEEAIQHVVQILREENII